MSADKLFIFHSNRCSKCAHNVFFFVSTILGLGKHWLIEKFSLSQLSFDTGNLMFSIFRVPSQLLASHSHTVSSFLRRIVYLPGPKNATLFSRECPVVCTACNGTNWQGPRVTGTYGNVTLSGDFEQRGGGKCGDSLGDYGLNGPRGWCGRVVTGTGFLLRRPT